MYTYKQFVTCSPSVKAENKEPLLLQMLIL